MMEKLKITSTIYSAARMGMKQSADFGPNFKLLKKHFKTVEVVNTVKKV